MSLKFYPDQGAVLICDFTGFKEPEMTKRRPVVVVSPKRKFGPRYCSIVPLSTTDPRPVKEFHFRMSFEPPLPEPYSERECWVKGDMLYQVSFDRLSLPCFGKDANGNRMYDQRTICGEEFADVQRAVARALGLPFDK